jgi:malonyl-CoA O-methyltransferase
VNILVSNPMAKTDPDTSAPPLDAHAAQRWQSLLVRSALHEGAPWLHEEVGSRMAQRLAWIKKQPANWVNWRAAASGSAVHARVAEQYPNSEVFLAPAGTESTLAATLLIANQGVVRRLIHKLQGQTKRILRPVEDGATQMVWANMALHTEPDPAAAVQAWYRMLAVDGYLMFSCLGPDTAVELREIYAKLGWGPAAHPLTDMHDWGDLLVGTGFAEPVMDMERITLAFASPERALQELRGIGRNLHPARFAGLRGQAWKAKLLHEMEALKNSQGQIEITFEMIYGHAFKPAPRLKMSAESAISMRDMRAMLSQARPK